MFKKTALALTVIFAHSSFFSLTANAGSSVSINGKTYTCDGSISANNDEVYCNGVRIDSKANNNKKQGPCGTISVHRYKNPDGSTGGWVNNKAQIESTVVVGPKAKVCGEVTLRQETQILDQAVLGGKGTLSGKTTIKDQVTITGNLEAQGLVTISGASIVSGSLSIIGNRAGVSISGAPVLSGTVIMKDSAKISGSPIVSGYLEMRQKSKLTGSAIVSGTAYLFDDSELGGDTIVSGKLTLREKESKKQGIFAN